MPRARATTFERGGKTFCRGCRKLTTQGKHEQCRTWMTHDPGSGFGAPDPRQEPMVLGVGLTSDPTPLLVSFVDYSDARYERWMDQLYARNPKWHAVWFAHVEREERLVEIAERLGITAENARYRQRQATVFMRDRRASDAA